MAIDKVKLTAYIDELGVSDAIRTGMLAEMEADEGKANKFIGQRLRHDDYTRKTQELSTTKTTLEQAVQTQISGYAAELDKANKQIAKIAADYEGESISRATAEARLNKVKTTYGLSDDDIPPVEQIVKQPVNAPTVDITKTLEDFRTNLIKDIRLDLQAMPQVTATQFDIAAQHQEVFGKRMTKAEMSELTELAQADRSNLQTAWEKKHDVQTVRTNKLVSDSIAAERTKWEDERRQANDAAALSSVTSQREDSPFGVGGRSMSPVLGRKYDAHVDSTSSQDPAAAAKPISPVAPQQTGPKLSGAERAAAAWIGKANAGLIGKPVPVTAK